MLKFLRYLLVGIVILTLMFLGLFVIVFRPKNVKNSDYFAPRLGAIALRILGIKIKFKNKKNFVKNRPCIFISNHQSNIDAWTIAAALPSGAITMGKKAILYLPIFGPFYYLCGHLLINRSDKVGSKAMMKKVASFLKNQQLSLWIMPEGTRNRGKGILPFKKGPFHLAIDSGLPIVPICISSYSKSFNLDKWHSGTISIEPLEAISVKGLSAEDVAPLAEKSRQILMDGVNKLDQEVMRVNG
jgi:1-acyl-sn-glycerol-3-phosphate acyltransferase